MEVKRNGTRAVIYARFSCDNQREESIDGQLRECNAYARSKGLLVVGNYIDRAISAKTDERPQFQKMIADSKSKAFDYVIVWKVDRFSRSRYDALKYKSVLKKHNVKVLSATEAISDGPEGILLESVLDGLAEYYSADLAEKVKRGMTDNALNGKCNGGYTTFGYDVGEDKKYVVNEVEGPIVKHIFVLYVNQNLNCSRIARRLAEEGAIDKKGNKISHNRVENVIHNRRYLGELRMNDVVNKIGFPQLVDQKIFDLAQEKRSRAHGHQGVRKAKEPYVLTGKLYCGYCGSHMVSESSQSHTGKVYFYYKCTHSKKRSDECAGRAFEKNLLERMVFIGTEEMLADQKIVDAIVDFLYEKQKQGSPYIKAMQAELDDVNMRYKNILEILETGGGAFEAFKERCSELENRRKKIEADMARERALNPFVEREGFYTILDFYRSLDINDENDRERLISTFVNQVFVYKDRVDVYLTLKGHVAHVGIDKEKEIMEKDASNGHFPAITKGGNIAVGGSPLLNTSGSVIENDNGFLAIWIRRYK